MQKQKKIKSVTVGIELIVNKSVAFDVKEGEKKKKEM